MLIKKQVTIMTKKQHKIKCCFLCGEFCPFLFCEVITIYKKEGGNKSGS